MPRPYAIVVISPGRGRREVHWIQRQQRPSSFFLIYYYQCVLQGARWFVSRFCFSTCEMPPHGSLCTNSMNCSKLASALKAPETRRKMSSKSYSLVLKAVLETPTSATETQKMSSKIYSRVLKASAPAPETQKMSSKACSRVFKALKTSWQKGRPNPFSRVCESGKSFVRTLMRHASQV